MRLHWFLALALAASTFGASRADGGDQLAEANASLTRAIVANDASAISLWLSEDWTIIDGSGGTIDRERFLAAIRSGELVHDSMELDQVQARLVGSATLWIARAHGSGRYRGNPFAFEERSVSVWTRRDGRWVCRFTQLTAIRPNG